MADKVVVLINKQQYGKPVPMETNDLDAFIGRMERFGVDYLGAGTPTVAPSENGLWIRFEFTLPEGED
jgi:hypothetical protein